MAREMICNETFEYELAGYAPKSVRKGAVLRADNPIVIAYPDKFTALPEGERWEDDPDGGPGAQEMWDRFGAPPRGR